MQIKTTTFHVNTKLYAEQITQMDTMITIDVLNFNTANTLIYSQISMVPTLKWGN